MRVENAAYQIPDDFIPRLSLDFSECPIQCDRPDLLEYLQAGITYNIQEGLVKTQHSSRGQLLISAGGLLSRLFGTGGLMQRTRVHFLRAVDSSIDARVAELVENQVNKGKVSNKHYVDIFDREWAEWGQFPLSDGRSTKRIPLITPAVALGIAICAIEHVDLTHRSSRNKNTLTVAVVCRRFWAAGEEKPLAVIEREEGVNNIAEFKTSSSSQPEILSRLEDAKRLFDVMENLGISTDEAIAILKTAASL